MERKRSELGWVMYNIDNDEFAFKVGRELESDPPNNTIIEKYSGPRDWPHLKYSDKSLDDMDYDFRMVIYRKSFKYGKDYVIPFLKKRNLALKPKYYLELHSTSVDDTLKGERIRFKFFPHLANISLRNLLKQYPSYQKSLTDKLNIFVYNEPPLSAGVGCLPTYHGLFIELMYYDKKSVQEHLVKISGLLVKNLCEFLNYYYYI
jgi:hypothetical protein